MPLILLLGLAGFASAVSLRATDPMLGLVAGDLGVTLQQAALLSSAYTLPYALMQVVLGPVGDAIGKALLIRIALAVLTVGLALSAVAPTYGTVMAARILAGGFAGGIIPGAMALIGDRVPWSGRQVAISRFLIAVILGQVCGSAAGGPVAELLGWRAVFGLSAGLTALVCAATLLGLRGQGGPRARLSFADARSRYVSVLANPVSLAVFATVALEGFLVLGAFPFVAPMLGGHGGSGAFEAGIVLVAFAGGGVLYSLTVRHLVAGLGQWRMMQAGGVLFGLCYLSMALPLAWPAVGAVFLVAGFAFYMLHNSLQTQATELAPTARGSAVALFAASFFLGQGAGPVVYGALAHRAGFTAPFLLAGTLMIALGFLGVRLIRR
ncbi:Predicted arabinose efflux permease, MFS family [Tistlia consotensis]|uniref:Predicted arabinose efflux permease, MFS family n=1 Tax=Tistlia consotensis USBA 355 TaxID=560819 RepID=A0A1Y6BM42_9PROT|nr:MFS transporter [Tistlia consotensis]SMF07882.1 Predicted arabinose efflux permease, MFS family [Tistlia consotensis USBA 355]SNR35665.1 Predicted arabinose efflux permease, MFS family [Tistlia consotensis]